MKAGIFASSLCFLVYAELREEEKCHDSLSPTSPCTMQVSEQPVPWHWRPRRLFVACLARSTVPPQTLGKRASHRARQRLLPRSFCWPGLVLDDAVGT